MQLIRYCNMHLMTIHVIFTIYIPQIATGGGCKLFYPE